MAEESMGTCRHEDCQRDNDYCCDCDNGGLYKSSDQPEPEAKKE